MERIDLSAVRSACRQRWANGSLWDERAVKVLIGEAADGRWYVWRYGGGPERVIAYGPANAEHYARKTAERWKRTIGGEWAEA